jgi:succinyl-CoA synthetase beta subunit
MKIHEYQAKQLFKEYGIPTTRDYMITTPHEAECVAEMIGLPVVLKAQVHTGGRGKAGGVKLAQRLDQVAPYAADILSLTIKGFPVRKLIVGPAVGIVSESYLSLLIDRATSKIVFVGCADGGMEIEDTAKTCPSSILRFEVTATALPKLTVDECLPFARQLVRGEDQACEVAGMMTSMGRLFAERDCSLIEINPLVVEETGVVTALDAKVLFDDNALFRQPANVEMRDMDSEDPDELIAREGNVTFVRLDGNIGCMVNGAGLAMGTMDIIKHFGGSPANFLDAGGSSDPKKVLAGLRLITKDPNVKAIFINIFGGITRCDDIAKGILAAKEQFDMNLPIVVRLAGTNACEGQDLIAGTDMIVADTLEQGAQRAVRLGNGV